jgi:hypothetical protein
MSNATVTTEPAPADSGAPEPAFIRIPPLAYLRAILALAWSTFRHPFKTTEIDLMTGRIVAHR